MIVIVLCCGGGEIRLLIKFCRRKIFVSRASRFFDAKNNVPAFESHPRMKQFIRSPLQIEKTLSGFSFAGVVRCVQNYRMEGSKKQS